MSLYIVDVEADGPIPSPYSMVCFGAVLVTEGTKPTFYGETAPLSETYNKEALFVSGFSRRQHEGFDDPKIVMANFAKWIAETNVSGRPTFMTDNLAFDWQWINWYFHTFTGSNPFGFSGRRIGDIYAGAMLDFKNHNEWKSLRRTSHDHNPVNDALGNAEAFLSICKNKGIRFD